MDTTLTFICFSRLLDLLLDVNNSAQIPSDKRIDLDVDIAALTAVPALVTAEDLSKATELATPAGQAIYNEIRSVLEEKASAKAVSKPPKSLALLMATTPHLSSNNPLVSPDLLTSLEAPEGLSAPISYITLDQMDDYLYDIDACLGTAPAPPHTQSPTAQDLQLRNPNSVYNWLRRNEPKIFLQDGEGSEKSLGKPGALRGAGKRASIPAPSKPDALEIVEEDGIGYDATLSGSVSIKGKRKREEDDGGYHPKKGSVDTGKKPRSKKKKIEGSGEMTSSSGSKKSKGKGRTSSPLAGEPPLFAPV